MKNNLEILFEDEDLVAVNKTAEMLTIPDRYNAKIPNLQNILTHKYGEIFTIHRLDKGTSGIVLFAKNADAHKSMNTIFQNHEIEKIYDAVTDGYFSEEPIEIDIPLMTDPNRKGRTIPSARGKASLTKAKLIKQYRHCALVKCKLITGRPHQLRVHMSAIGTPLLVDSFYGKRTEFLVSEFKKKFNLKKRTEELPLITRQTMHAFSLKFVHPETNEEVLIEAPYPKDFRALVKVLDNHDS
jgi:RluA family pseudouridine synthase